MLQYVAGTVGRLEESVDRGFREQREALAALAAATVTRREFDQQHGELRARVDRIEAAREAERAAAEVATREAARDARSRRWQVVALAVGTTVSVAGVASGVVLHFT